MLYLILIVVFVALSIFYWLNAKAARNRQRRKERLEEKQEEILNIIRRRK